MAAAIRVEKSAVADAGYYAVNEGDHVLLIPADHRLEAPMRLATLDDLDRVLRAAADAGVELDMQMLAAGTVHHKQLEAAKASAEPEPIIEHATPEPAAVPVAEHEHHDPTILATPA